MQKRILYLLLFFFVINLDSQGQRKKIEVLFLGNSLTYFNNLPELVKQIAASDSVEMNYFSLSFPNYALIDHWNDGKAQQEIKSGKYDFVVVQQGPSAQMEGRTYLIDWGLKFDALCDQYHAKMVSYMVWPAKARFSDFPEVFETYKLLADTTNGIFSPSGNAWLKVWENYPDFKLYGEDNFHPDYRGSLLSALVIYGSMMKKKNLQFVDFNKVKIEGFIKSDLKILIRAAQRTLSEKK